MKAHGSQNTKECVITEASWTNNSTAIWHDAAAQTTKPVVIVASCLYPSGVSPMAFITPTISLNNLVPPRRTLMGNTGQGLQQLESAECAVRVRIGQLGVFRSPPHRR